MNQSKEDREGLKKASEAFNYRAVRFSILIFEWRNVLVNFERENISFLFFYRPSFYRNLLQLSRLFFVQSSIKK